MNDRFNRGDYFSDDNIYCVNDIDQSANEGDELYSSHKYFLEKAAERKHRATLLEEVEAKFNNLVEKSLTGIYIIQDERFVYVNPRFAEIFGYTYEEFIDMPVRDIAYEEDRELVLNNLKKRIYGEIDSIRYQFRGLTKDHQVIYVEVLGNQFTYQGKKSIIGSLIDISERVKNHEKLRMANEIFENTIEGIVVTDIKGNIHWVNPAFSKITGYTLEEVLGKNPRILKSDRHDDAFYRNLWSTLRRTGQWKGEIWNRRKNGEVYPEWMTISTIKNDFEEPVRYISVFNDITERILKEEHIKYQAYHDALTGLPNRLLVNDRLEVALTHAQRNKEQIAVMFIDLDRFKNINDTLGHAMGDMLLKEVAQRLVQCVRKGDTVARLGGDEFIIILENIKHVEYVVDIVQKIFTSLSHSYLLKDHEIFVTGSIGISIFPMDGEDVDTLIKHADTAMYRAKEQGRNTYQLFTSSMNERAMERLSLENDLRKAIIKNEFLVYYQPQMEIKTGNIIGAEALIRWMHPTMGLVPPGQFIPIAEETGLIEQIGEWVLMEACCQMKAWHNQGFGDMKISVNLSMRQFHQGDLVEKVNAALKNAKLAPKYLDLEITESCAMQDPDFTISVISQLRAQGVTFSIDDFGTGYSSLALLKAFPIHKLKIDKSFIHDIDEVSENLAIVLAIIDMAHRLKLRITAEGVETEKQLELLRIHLCDEVQGYLLSPPLKPEDFEKLMIKGKQGQC
ncbi:MAG: EAL domain-containing protein [Bacillota bacterium]